MKSYIAIIILSLSCQVLVAQSVTDVIRYSSLEISGTARSLGSGSAMGALGADFSVLSTNPAGLAWYRNSEFTITPAIFTSGITTKLSNLDDNEPAKSSRSNFVLSNFGVVVASQPSSANWKTFNFGLGINRIADFNQRFYFEGASVGSIVDRFLEQANSSTGLEEFESQVAYDADALIGPDSDGFYYSDFENAPNAFIQRDQTISWRGSINELTFAMAGNYKDRVLVGATIGVPFLSFREEKSYHEEDPGDGVQGNVPFFDNLEYNETLTTTGAGINLKLGMLFRVNQWVRLGVAAHTPTAFSLEDSYHTDMTYVYSDNGTPYEGSAESPDGLFEYKLRSPWRLIGSLALVIKKHGFITAEVEAVDYAGAELRFDGYDSQERETNNEIAKTLTTATNMRVGGELAVDIFRFRAGIGLLQSPFIDENTVNSSYSLGVGIREENFFIDLGYRRYNYKESYTPYLTSVSEQQIVDRDIANNRFLLTLGFKF